MNRKSMLKTICPIFLAEGEEFEKGLDVVKSSTCDLIEIRLDEYYRDHGLEVLKKKLAELDAGSIGKEVIWTMRTAPQGGKAEISPEEYAEVIDLINQLPGLSDIELDQVRRLGDKYLPERTVLSWHDFEETPTTQELAGLWDEMEGWKPKIEKISVMPKNSKDVQNLLQSCKNHQTNQEKIAISMSELGKISRILADFYGSGYTFASAITTSAPGQPSLEELTFYRSAFADR